MLHYLTYPLHGAPAWAWGAISLLLVAEFLIGKYSPKAKSVLELLGSATLYLLAKFPPTAALGNALKQLLGLAAFLLFFGAGCATSGMPAGATLAQKAQADVAVANIMRNDIVTKCPKMAPIAPLVADALAVGTDPTNVLNDILTAVAAVPALAQDYEAIKCAVQVVLDDYKTYFKAQPSPAAAAKITMLEQILVQLGDTGVGATLCASR